MAPSKALVTGGTGFIGSHLVEALLDRGDQVRCLVRRTSSTAWLRGLDVEACEGDCTDLFSLKPAVEGVTEIYQIAGVTRAGAPAAFYRTNALGTENVVAACIKRNPSLRRFVYLSSQAAAGPCEGEGRSVETDPCRPISHYGRSKRQGEETVLRFRDQLNVVILRACVVYGPRDRDFLPYFRFIRRGMDIGLWGIDQRLSLCYVSDLVSAIIKAGKAERPSGETFFISDGNVYRWSDVGKSIAEAMGVRVIRLRLPAPVFRWCGGIADWLSKWSGKSWVWGKERYQELVQPNWCCDSTKAMSELGFSPSFDLKRGVTATLEWYRAKGWLSL